MKPKILSVIAIAATIAVLPVGNSGAAITDAWWDQTTFTDPAYTAPGTSVTIDLNAAGDAADIGIVTSYDPSADPIFKFFRTDGAAGTLVLNETITNSGATPWTDWDEIVLGFNCPLTGPCWGAGAVPVPQVGAAMWNIAGASVGGVGGTFFNYEYYVDVDGDGVAETLTDYLALDFATLVLTGQPFTVGKLIDYGPGLDLIVVAEFPTVPVPAALPLMAAGLAALGFVARRNRRAALPG